MSLSLSLSSSAAAAAVGVDKATSDLLMGPDWTLNIEICDAINCNRWQAKDVVKAVKKRLQHKNPKVQFLALTLLETMIKNCGDYLHFQVVEREILQEMLKIVRKKAEMQVRDKILELIDSWQEAFGGSGGKYPQFYWAYTDLRRSGVIFPKRSPDATLKLTPSENATPSVRHPQIPYGTSNGSGSRLDEAMMSEMATLSLADLPGMKTVTDLLSEMLKAVDLNDRNAVEDEVIKDLVHQCAANQKKLVDSISSISDADGVLLAQALELNDNLQNLLAKHDALASGLPVPAHVSESTPNSLPTVAPQHATRRQYNNDDDEEDDDDDFAQLARRTSTMKPEVAHGKSTATGDQSTLFNQSDIMLSTGASSAERGASYMLGSNSLALPDPPAPIETTSKDHEMMDLFSLTLLSNPLPSHASLPYDESKPPTSVQPTDPDPLYAPENSYVASWARKHAPTTCPPQSHFQPEMFDNSSAYPPPPWATSPDNANANNPFAYNPFLSSTATYQNTPSGVGAAAGYTSLHDSRLVQHFNGDGLRVHNAPAAPVLDHRPYVYTNRLFSELLSQRNSSPGLGDTAAGSSASETPRQGTLNQRK